MKGNNGDVLSLPIGSPTLAKVSVHDSRAIQSVNSGRSARSNAGDNAVRNINLDAFGAITVIATR